MSINQNNFFENTKGRFTECDLPTGLISSYVSIGVDKKVSSTYFYTEVGVYRLSNHWGGVASCQWNLNTVNDFGMDKCRKTEQKTGYISFNELNQNKELELELLNAYGNDFKFNQIKERINGTY